MFLPSWLGLLFPGPRATRTDVVIVVIVTENLSHALVLRLNGKMQFLTSLMFSIAGLINAIFASNFDDISIIPTFVLTPLTYLGGVFYSINLLGDFWRDVSMFNPILYMVNAFRFGISGITDINIIWSFSMVGLASVVLFLFALHLLEKGSRLRS